MITFVNAALVVFIIGFVIWWNLRPPKPLNLQGTWAEDEAIFTWKSMDGIDKYEVFYRSTQQWGEQWSSKLVFRTSMAKVNVKTGLPYEVCVTAKNWFGASSASATIYGCARASAPNDFTAICDSEKPVISLTWNEVSCGCGYVVKRKVATEDSFRDIVTLQHRTSTQTQDTSVTYGLSYTYIVASMDRSGKSSSSTSIIVRPRVPPPKYLVASTSKTLSKAIQLSWQPEPNTLAYHIYRHCVKDRVIQNATPLVILRNPSANSYLDRSVTNQVMYTYTIASEDAAGISKPSTGANGMASLPAVSKLTAEPVHGTPNIILSWSEVTDAAAYRIWKSDDYFQTEKVLGSLAHEWNTKFVDSAAKSRIVYSYMVQAVDGTGAYGPKSRIASATVFDVTPSSDRQKSHQGNIERPKIDVRFGDLMTEQTDAIVVCLLSDELKKKVLAAAGQNIPLGNQKDDASGCFEVSGNLLPCKKILFVPWKNFSGSANALEQSVHTFMTVALQFAQQQSYTTMSFPAIGCGGLGFDTDVVAKAMISEAHKQLTSSLKNQIQISFIIQYGQQTVYDEFTQQLHSLDEPTTSTTTIGSPVPKTWEMTNGVYDLWKKVSDYSEEAQVILADFHRTMNEIHCQPRLLGIERVQNERWFHQYQSHKKEFNRRLQKDTEKRLFHGCANGSTAARSVSDDGFNRSLAGTQHGTAYGRGVYFSSKASESHRYTQPSNGSSVTERHMFVCKVLLGKTIRGDSTMHKPPTGYHSTGNDSSIYVIYHDAQAYAEYLIIYR